MSEASKVHCCDDRLAARAGGAAWLAGGSVWPAGGLAGG